MKKILVVDDDKIVSSVLKHKLEHEGFEVTIAETVDRANELISTHSYDLITLDLIIDTRSGYEVLEKNSGIKTPIVVTSNLNQDEDKEKSIKLGAKAYFSKLDMSLNQIFEEIKKIVK